MLRGCGIKDRPSIGVFPKISDHRPRSYIGDLRADIAFKGVAASSDHSRASKGDA